MRSCPGYQLKSIISLCRKGCRMYSTGKEGGERQRWLRPSWIQFVSPPLAVVCLLSICAVATRILPSFLRSHKNGYVGGRRCSLGICFGPTWYRGSQKYTESEKGQLSNLSRSKLNNLVKFEFFRLEKWGREGALEDNSPVKEACWFGRR